MWWTGWGPELRDGGSWGRRFEGTSMEIDEGSWSALLRAACLRRAMSFHSASCDADIVLCGWGVCPLMIKCLLMKILVVLPSAFNV